MMDFIDRCLDSEEACLAGVIWIFPIIAHFVTRGAFFANHASLAEFIRYGTLVSVIGVDLLLLANGYYFDIIHFIIGLGPMVIFFTTILFQHGAGRGIAIIMGMIIAGIMAGLMIVFCIEENGLIIVAPFFIIWLRVSMGIPDLLVQLRYYFWAP